TVEARVVPPMVLRAALGIAIAGALAAAGPGRASAQPPPAAAPPAPEEKPAGPAEQPAGPAEQPASPPDASAPEGGAEESAPAPANQARRPHRGSGKPGACVVVDRVVAVVNDAVNLHSELMRGVAPLSGEYADVAEPRERERRKAKLKSQILDEMVNEELIIQAAEESKLEVTAKEVQSSLEEIKKQNKLDDNQLAEALRMQGYSMSSYRKDVRRQILRMRATNMLVRPRVTVTDDDVRARYDAMSRRSAGVKRVKLRHILIELPAKPTEAQVAAAKREAAEIIEKVRGGADFARLAAEHSDDEGTKYQGGDLNWIERGSIDTEWEVIVFAMNKGE